MANGQRGDGLLHRSDRPWRADVHAAGRVPREQFGDGPHANAESDAHAHANPDAHGHANPDAHGDSDAHAHADTRSIAVSKPGLRGERGSLRLHRAWRHPATRTR